MAKTLPPLALIALAALAAFAAAQQPPHTLRYTIEYNSTSLTPGHGTPTTIYIHGILTAHLVEAKPPLYTYEYRVIVDEVELRGFPGNDTQARQQLIATLAQPRNTTIDASRCTTIGGEASLNLPLYCNPEALAKLEARNTTIREEDGKLIVEAKARDTRLYAVYSRSGILLEAKIVTETPASHETLKLHLVETSNTHGKRDYLGAAATAATASAASGSATLAKLRARKRRL